MKKNSLSWSRVSAGLVVHHSKKSATKFYNQAWYFLQIRSKISERWLRQVLYPCVIVEIPL